jgi:hypothetical protein
MGKLFLPWFPTIDSMIEIGKCIKIAEFRHVEALDLGEN